MDAPVYSWEEAEDCGNGAVFGVDAEGAIVRPCAHDVADGVEFVDFEVACGVVEVELEADYVGGYLGVGGEVVGRGSVVEAYVADDFGLGGFSLALEGFGGGDGCAGVVGSKTRVKPPARAARVPVRKSSLWVAPGSRRWTWGSMRPGRRRSWGMGVLYPIPVRDGECL